MPTLEEYFPDARPRSREDLMAARLRVAKLLDAGDLTETQRSILSGMSGALQWACGDDDPLLQGLLGE